VGRAVQRATAGGGRVCLGTSPQADPCFAEAKTKKKIPLFKPKQNTLAACRANSPGVLCPALRPPVLLRPACKGWHRAKYLGRTAKGARARPKYFATAKLLLLAARVPPLQGARRAEARHVRGQKRGEQLKKKHKNSFNFFFCCSASKPVRRKRSNKRNTKRNEAGGSGTVRPANVKQSVSFLRSAYSNKARVYLKKIYFILANYLLILTYYFYLYFFFFH
jgi:hypothetical protein